jgi:hypothetical protein
MVVAEAVNKGKQTNLTAKQRYLSKQFSRPVSVTGILQFMNEQLKLNNYGPMAPIAKKNKHKINGFIKFLQNNDFTNKEIYEFVQKCVENWDDLLKTDIFTDNRKKYTLDTVPNIIDIIHCKTQFFNEINKKQVVFDEDEADIWEMWGEL